MKNSAEIQQEFLLLQELFEDVCKFVQNELSDHHVFIMENNRRE